MASTNSEIVEEKAKKVEEIKALQSDARELTEMEQVNSKLISKIQSFLDE